MNLRLSAGLVCVLAAGLFPYAAGNSADAWQQIFSLGILCAAALLWGPVAAPPLVGAVVLLMGLVMAISPNPYVGQWVAGIAGVVLAGVAYHVGAGLRFSSRGLSWVLFAFAAAAALNALEGMLQWLGLVGELYRWMAEPERRGIAFGAFRQPNLFATYLCIGAVCTVWLRHRQQLSSFMAWFVSVVLMFGVAASGSRTGVLEVGALVALGLFWRKRHDPVVTRLMIGQGVLLVMAMLLLPWLAELHGFGFSSGLERAARSGSDGRLTIWANAVEMIAQRPWTGWGWREMGYGRYITLFPHRFEGLLEHAHNLPLQLAVEFGLPLTVLASCFVLRLVWVAKPWRIHEVGAGPAPQVASGQQFAWTVLLLIGIHSMLEFPLWYANFLFIAGLFCGYLLPSGQSPTRVPHPAWTRPAASCMALVLIALALVAWRQYDTVLPLYKTPFTNDKEVRRKAGRAALEGAASAWLFREHLDFAELGLTDVTPENASAVRRQAEKLLHYSAEPRVIQPLLSSLWLLQDIDALRFHAERFCRAFPQDFRRWQEFYSAHPMVAALGALPRSCLASASHEKKGQS